MTNTKINLNTTINKIINKIEKFESKKIQLSAKYISETHFNGGKLFLFGTGHNHCLAEEGLHRAGGYANACPILDDNINFAKGIKKASKAAFSVASIKESKYFLSINQDKKLLYDFNLL